ncbi:MAG: tyrosine-type recombinase/integrase [Planctomycetes bacterium]|nr:tyrosine-type recombinase/integrase [Planctomycetota bacterium]
MSRANNGAWYRSGKDAWYATIGGRSVSLGIRGKNNRKLAQEAFYKLMADGPAEKKPKPTVTTVRDLIDAFLADATTRLKAATLGMYRHHLDGFGESLGSSSLDRLIPADVSRWLAKLGVSETTKGIRLRSVSACLGWGVRNGWLEHNPVERVTRPKSRSRSETTVISAEDHAKLINAASAGFRFVLRLLHGTGCRPGEIARISATNFYPDAGLVRLNEHKADHTGRPRLIFLTPDLVEELKLLVEKHPDGSLLRSRGGKPWTARAIMEGMRRLRKLTGVKAIAYGYRHTFATDGLVNGLPDAQVAALLGHGSTQMLHRHYSHLTSQAGVLRNAAAMVRPAAKPETPNEPPTAIPA